jgi:pimeloyl-ACP methyl ester carboxylesterase
MNRVSGLVVGTLCLAALLPPPAAAQAMQQGQGRGPAATGGGAPLTLDHYVPVKSLVPAIEGQVAQIYVHERVRADVVERQVPADRVVVFVHGAGTPAEVGFDVPRAGYSWMAYLAEAGFDVFSVEMSGYGRSTRPYPMNDICNLPAARQTLVARVQRVPGEPDVVAAPTACESSYPHSLTTSASDWNDLAGAVDYVRTLRGVERVSLIGWSAGGPRAGGYALAHPDKVAKLVLLAPAYNRNGSATPPTLPANGTPYNVQTYEEFLQNWQRQAPCPAQFDPALAAVIWEDMLESDPVGASWGPGVRRAPQTTTWGWNQQLVGTLEAPTLLISGEHDAQVAPARVRELHEDLGSTDKVFVDLGCAGHSAMWEKNRELLFRASLDWLTKGTVQGMRQGVVRLGY